jgi:hypothetical protein
MQNGALKRERSLYDGLETQFRQLRASSEITSFSTDKSCISTVPVSCGEIHLKIFRRNIGQSKKFDVAPQLSAPFKHSVRILKLTTVSELDTHVFRLCEYTAELRIVRKHESAIHHPLRCTRNKAADCVPHRLNQFVSIRICELKIVQQALYFLIDHRLASSIRLDIPFFTAP